MVFIFIVIFTTFFLSLRIWSSSSLLYLQRFGWYVLRPSSGVSCPTREPTKNLELKKAEGYIGRNIESITIKRKKDNQASSQKFTQIVFFFFLLFIFNFIFLHFVIKLLFNAYNKRILILKKYFSFSWKIHKNL